jgi:hypothetical protein
MRILVLTVIMSFLSHSAFASLDDGYGLDNGYGHFVKINDSGKEEVSAAERLAAEEEADEGHYGLADYGYVTSEDETDGPAAAAEEEVGGAGAGNSIFYIQGVEIKKSKFRLSTETPKDLLYLHPKHLRAIFDWRKKIEKTRQELRRVPTPTPRDSDDGVYSDIEAEKCLENYLNSTSAPKWFKAEQYYLATQIISRRAVVAAFPILKNQDIAYYCIKGWQGKDLTEIVLREQVSPTAVDADLHTAKFDIIKKINETLTPIPEDQLPKMQAPRYRSNSFS